jgi:hypothetical protein
MHMFHFEDRVHTPVESKQEEAWQKKKKHFILCTHALARRIRHRCQRKMQ